MADNLLVFVSLHAFFQKYAWMFWEVGQVQGYFNHVSIRINKETASAITFQWKLSQNYG